MEQCSSVDAQNMKAAAVLIRGGLLVVVLATSTATIAEEDRTGIEFFESHIRPLLVRRCYECHSSKAKTIEGGLRLDSSAWW